MIDLNEKAVCLFVNDKGVVDSLWFCERHAGG